MNFKKDTKITLTQDEIETILKNKFDEVYEDCNIEVCSINFYIKTKSNEIEAEVKTKTSF